LRTVYKNNAKTVEAS